MSLYVFPNIYCSNETTKSRHAYMHKQKTYNNHLPKLMSLENYKKVDVFPFEVPQPFHDLKQQIKSTISS